MRRILFACVLALPCLSGCMMWGDRSHCGYHFEILKPPTIDTNTPMLVQQSAGTLNAHPIGTAAGPVQGGQFQQGPTNQPPLQMQPMIFGQRAVTHPCEPMPSASLRLSYEEWCERQRMINAKPLPKTE